jgi:predicted DNA-binding transcriptional regulator
MNKDQAAGVAILVGSVAGIIVYAWLLCSFTIIMLQLTAFLAVAAVLVILAWIGWTMATTPPLEPIDYEPPASTASDEAEKKDKPQTKTAS